MMTAAPPRRIAVTGANGRLGAQVCALDWSPHTITPLTRAEADLSDQANAHRALTAANPQIVIHTASCTDLVKCENDKQFGWDNVALPAIHVARFCAERAVRLVHVSTDYVFSGNEPAHPIPPMTRPEPVNYYGLAKVAAESAARVVPDSLIIRTTMKERGRWKHPVAPDDMWISHSYYDEVAEAVKVLGLSQKQGLHHFGRRQVNVFEMARQMDPSVRPVKRSDIGTLRLPGDIRLEIHP